MCGCKKIRATENNFVLSQKYRAVFSGSKGEISDSYQLFFLYKYICSANMRTQSDSLNQ